MNYWQNYWQQTASPYVSAAVLVGGLLSAVILFFLTRVELGAQAFAASNLTQGF